MFIISLFILGDQAEIRDAPNVQLFYNFPGFYIGDAGQGDFEISGKVKLKLEHVNDLLKVWVIEASNVGQHKYGLTPDSFVEVCLLPVRDKQTKRRTTVEDDTMNPIYNQFFEVHL